MIWIFISSTWIFKTWVKRICVKFLKHGCIFSNYLLQNSFMKSSSLTIAAVVWRSTSKKQYAFKRWIWLTSLTSIVFEKDHMVEWVFAWVFHGTTPSPINDLVVSIIHLFGRKCPPATAFQGVTTHMCQVSKTVC